MKTHKAYLDILRLLCIVLVVFNHTPAFHEPLMQPVGENFGHLLISLVVKIAVPVFFMISGALLLKKDEPYKELLCKRILRFVVVILLFTLLRYSYLCSYTNVKPSLLGYFSACINPNKVIVDADASILKTRSLGAGAVWFLYAYLGLLLMLPMLRAMVKNMRPSVYIYMVAVFMIFQVALPVVSYFSSYMYPDVLMLKYIPLISGDFIKSGTYSVFFFILGYYIEEHVDIKKVTVKGLLIFGAVAFACLLTDGMLVRHVGDHIKNIKQEAVQGLPWFNGCMLPMYAFVYLAVKKLFVNFDFSAFSRWGLQKLGGAVFTVFIFENIGRREFSPLFEDYSTAYLPSVWVTLLTVASGLLIGLLLKEIPGIKKLI